MLFRSHRVRAHPFVLRWMKEQESRKAVDEVNELIEFWAEELDVVEE